ncbi:S1 family peptidase [Streptomonospora litoralis]|uniref:Alpha-lytic protease n=1 Tax=Streptomonospora litoralis TaxID=2498135 RepID=A0A4P6QAJ7_9ACTN|nr:S1 family peptidase [Streptomonospora litoralis]QBI56569.1 Alpha-lytic protease precursor [Streptomonospora litoralis]
MRKSPRFMALGGVVLSMGLMAAATTAAAADPAPTAAPEQLDAMQRDLGLTESEAKQLIQQESRARSLQDELRADLGSDFGGAVFDTETGELTVSVTDADAADTVEDAGADAEVVTYGRKALDKVVADLNASSEEAASGVTGWYADVEADTVVMTVEQGAAKAGRKLVAEAGVAKGAVKVEESTEQPETFADIVGGDAYYINGSSRCSVGFAVTTGFVTAGHCGGAGDSVSGANGGSGSFAGSVFPSRDMGYVRANAGWNPTPRVNDYSGGTVNVAGSARAPIGSSICRSGSTTGWHCGTIQARNQTVRYPQGTVYGLTRTNVCAEPGDSGGSWVSGNQAQGVTSGGSGNCSWGGTTYYQEVNPILQRWGLTLA